MKFFCDKDIVFIRKLIIIVLVAVIIVLMLSSRINFRKIRYFNSNNEITHTAVINLNIINI